MPKNNKPVELLLQNRPLLSVKVKAKAHKTRGDKEDASNHAESKQHQVHLNPRKKRKQGIAVAQLFIDKLKVHFGYGNTRT